MFLAALVESTKKRVEKTKKNLPLKAIKASAMIKASKEGLAPCARTTFEDVLRGKGISFICEVKKASPSKGIIAPEFPYKEIVSEYEEAGAHAISVLTEPEYFLGSGKHLQEIKKLVQLPLLRKDFIVDEYQIYESKLLGADAVLLICTLLETSMLKRFIEICDTLGLSHLVEVRNAPEISQAIRARARVIGINNRNLKDFKVDTANSLSLRRLIPQDIICVAESGISTRNEVMALEKIGVDGVLIGEALMKSKDKKAKLQTLMAKK